MDLVEPMFDAVVTGDEELVSFYLQLGASISSVDLEGRTALHWTAASDLGEQLIPFLIKKGSLLNAQDNNGYTPLHAHAARGRIYGVAALLFHGADPNIQAFDSNESTPLLLAIQHNHSPEFCNILLSYGAILPQTVQEIYDKTGRIPSISKTGKSRNKEESSEEPIKQSAQDNVSNR